MSFPHFDTERLIIRKLVETDAPAIFALRSNDSVRQFIDRPKAENINEARHFISMINNEMIEKNKWFYWGIQLKNGGSLVGTICLYNISWDKKISEIGYELLPSFQGKGIMQEALQNIIAFAFETCRLKKMEAFSQQANKKSEQLLLKNSFNKTSNIKTFDGNLYNYYFLENAEEPNRQN